MYLVIQSLIINTDHRKTNKKIIITAEHRLVSTEKRLFTNVSKSFEINQRIFRN